MQLVEESGLNVRIDSAGTAGYHKGAPPDKRSQQVSKTRGVDISGLKCRRVTDEDFEDFDYIVAMDKSNVRELKRKCPEDLQRKITLLLSYWDSRFDEVPDPYYGGGKGFEMVYDLIEQGSKALLASIVQSQKEA